MPSASVNRFVSNALRHASSHVSLAPLAHRLGHRPQRLAVFGQRILDAWRHFGEHLATDDAVGFQLPQLARENAVTDPGRLAPQFSEAVRTRVHHVEDQHGLPLAADDREGGLLRASKLVVHANLPVSSSPQSAFLSATALGRSVAPMKIAIIGAGNVGRALGGGWRGHDITYGVRSPDDPKHADLESPVTMNEAAVVASDVVALCAPWQGTEQAVKACGNLAGKVLIDCTTRSPPISPPW